MATLGEILREARLSKGVSLSAIAEETKISSRYLQAVESEELGALPGALFARNFARQYAAYLNLDMDEVEESIRRAFPLVESDNLPVLAGATKPIRVAPLREYRFWHAANLKRVGMSLAALAAVAGAGSAVHRLWQEVPQMVAVARQEAERSKAELERPDNVVSTVRNAGGDVDARVNHDESGEETTITISGSGMAVQLVASARAWVSITANGKRIFSGTLEPNQRKTVSGVENAKIVVGNAGGLQVLTDGRDIGPIGPDGQVRVVILSPEGPQIQRAQPAASERRTST